MTNPTDVKPTQGINASSFEWLLDIALVPVSPAAPSWLNYPDITALQPNGTPKTSDGTTYANKGQDDVSTIGESFNLALNGKIVKNALGEAMPVVSLLIDAADAHLDGGDPSKKVILARYYHFSIPDLAYEFSAEVNWARQNTGNADNEFFSFTLTSKGDRKKISNPAVGPAVAPTIDSATPSGAAEGEWVQIVGTGLNRVTNVTFGGTVATVILPVSESQLFAQMPAGTSGSAPIIATSPAGSSTGFAYTRGA